MYKCINSKDVSKLIKKQLIDMDIKNVEIADKLGVSRQRVSNILAKDNITIKDIVQILNAIDCDLFIEIRQKTEEIE